jgi:hypothetical protein
MGPRYVQITLPSDDGTDLDVDVGADRADSDQRAAPGAVGQRKLRRIQTRDNLSLEL